MWYFRIDRETDSWDVQPPSAPPPPARNRAPSTRSRVSSSAEHELMTGALCKRSEWLHSWNVRRAAVCMEPLSLVWRGGWRPGSVLLDDACIVTVEPTSRYNIEGASLLVQRDGRTLVFRAAPGGADLTTWWATIAQARQRAEEAQQLLRRRSSRRVPDEAALTPAGAPTGAAPPMGRVRSAPATAQRGRDAWGDEVRLRRRKKSGFSADHRIPVGTGWPARRVLGLPIHVRVFSTRSMGWSWRDYRKSTGSSFVRVLIWRLGTRCASFPIALVQWRIWRGHI